MRHILKAFIFIYYILICATVGARTPQPIVEKPPSWITINSLQLANNQLDLEAEDGYVDLVFERQIFLKEQLRIIGKPLSH